MKKTVLSVLLWLSAFVSPAHALDQYTTRGILTWAYNLRKVEYIDSEGYERCTGMAQIRVYQSHAPNSTPFYLSSELGAVFTLYLNATLVGHENYLNQPYWTYCGSYQNVTDDWCRIHYCQWAAQEPYDDLPRVYPENGEDPWPDRETPSFSGNYSFPAGAPGGPTTPGGE